MLEHFWERLLPGQMTRIQEPDLLIDHDSGGGGGGCHRFLGGPVEPFTYSGVNSMKIPGHALKTSKGSSGKWFPFTSVASPCSTRVKKAEAVSLSSNIPSAGSSTEEKPIIVVHNNNNNTILDMMDENTRWSSSTANNVHSCKSTPPTPIRPPVLPPGSTGNTGNTTKCRLSSSNCNSSGTTNNSKPKHSKNNNSNNNNNLSNKNNCSSSSSNLNNKSTANSRINNCEPTSVTTTATSHINSGSIHHHHHHHHNRSNDNDEVDARHLIIRYIHCNERPNKKQLVTLGLITVLFSIILIILLALFLSPSSTRTLGGSSNTSSRNEEISDAFISSDITSSLNSDDADLDDSDSYDDSDSAYFSSTTSSNINTGLDMKKVSKLSWDLLNSNQDANSRGGGGGGGAGGNKGSSVLPPLVGGGGSDGEIILPAKMIYTSSGDSTDLKPSENSNGSSGGNKKRSCCRTQKYSQVIKREGCEPLTIVNKMCFGQCVSVWVPGLFASFPVCRPSKSTFKMVTLTCGRNREKRRRVRIEKVRRCSCMEIEPTTASL